MEDVRTCGKGLAERSAVPAKMAELLEALVENLEIHRDSLDLTDERSRLEADAYGALVEEYAELAARLAAAARHMGGYRDLPMGDHDPEALGSPRTRRAFESFVAREEDLFALLSDALARDRDLLGDLAAAPN